MAKILTDMNTQVVWKHEKQKCKRSNTYFHFHNMIQGPCTKQRRYVTKVNNENCINLWTFSCFLVIVFFCLFAFLLPADRTCEDAPQLSRLWLQLQICSARSVVGKEGIAGGCPGVQSLQNSGFVFLFIRHPWDDKSGHCSTWKGSPPTPRVCNLLILRLPFSYRFFHER